MDVRRVSGVFSVLGAAVCGAGVALAAAGCGHTATLKPGRTLGLALMEYRLRPAHVVARAGPIRVSLHNYGRLTHNLEILRPTPTRTVATTATGTVSYTTTVAARSPDLAPGQSTTLTVRLAPGHYTLASNVSADQSLGAQGTLSVTSK